MNVLEWANSTDVCCVEWSFTCGQISGGARSWYYGKGYCTFHTVQRRNLTTNDTAKSVWRRSIDSCCAMWSFAGGSVSCRLRRSYHGDRHCASDAILLICLKMQTWMTQHPYSPLIQAATRGCLAVVEYLVEKGAALEAVDNVRNYQYNHVSGTSTWMVIGWEKRIDVCCVVQPSNYCLFVWARC